MWPHERLAHIAAVSCYRPQFAWLQKWNVRARSRIREHNICIWIALLDMRWVWPRLGPYEIRRKLIKQRGFTRTAGTPAAVAGEMTIAVQRSTHWPVSTIWLCSNLQWRHRNRKADSCLPNLTALVCAECVSTNAMPPCGAFLHVLASFLMSTIPSITPHLYLCSFAIV
jgi:hypothetical protein